MRSVCTQLKSDPWTPFGPGTVMFSLFHYCVARSLLVSACRAVERHSGTPPLNCGPSTSPRFLRLRVSQVFPRVLQDHYSASLPSTILALFRVWAKVVLDTITTSYLPLALLSAHFPASVLLSSRSSAHGNMTHPG
ncbi:hypothetical protein BDW02DRAFT_365392 [Decorospora gaudefroyi]|uniref:Uncharacterized protein n=1 Tax=Decorospora gaudefroyi TaxID=184978 RepID=A0A6A5KRC7_9PLEO|nr:hypothetical protein BDW02DRAFT_365392 [Decorospora gaudefroyi]